jgi:hypothetical protein
MGCVVAWAKHGLAWWNKLHYYWGDGWRLRSGWQSVRVPPRQRDFSHPLAIQESHAILAQHMYAVSA